MKIFRKSKEISFCFLHVRVDIARNINLIPFSHLIKMWRKVESAISKKSEQSLESLAARQKFKHFYFQKQ